jgi:cytochrome b subunit of formate dehydrogenase
MTNDTKNYTPKRAEDLRTPFSFHRSRIVIKDGVKFFYRFTIHQRLQHVVLFLSVLALIFTGVPLKYPEAPGMDFLYRLFGGISIVPTIHHISGVIMCLLFVYHTIYFLYIYLTETFLPMKRRGELTLWSALVAFYEMPMVPHVRDVTDFYYNMKYLFFVTDKKPTFEKFMWKEKYDYYAVYWGIPILGLSGLLMWQRDFFSQFLPGVMLNISYIMHTDEALLAATFLVVWHFYNVHFHRHKFPMGRVFITGYLSEEEMIEEHYEEYVMMMKAGGFESEIVGQYDHAAHGASSFREGKPYTMVYGFIMMGVIAALTFMILKQTILSKHGFFPPHEQEAVSYEEKRGQPKVVEAVRLEGLNALEGFKGKKEYIGYRITAGKEVKGHFHTIGMEVTPCTKCSCIKCHGDLCHEDLKEVRAFINMHSSYMSCEVCHSRPAQGQPAGVFQWAVKMDGHITREPVGSYGLQKKVDYKIIYLGKEGRSDSLEMNAMVDKYRKIEKDMGRAQKVEAIKAMHQSASREAVKCRDCHTQQKPYLPFDELGYSAARIKELQGNAVIGMIEKYEKFYLPQLFSGNGEKR